jgi:ElaB/YqjD/DUF883 family membrane-anchored ribosome-binding protein
MVVFSIVVPMAGCGKVQQSLKTVLAKAPTVIAIVNTAIDLYKVVDPTGADPTLKATVDNLAQKITDDLRALNNIIATFQADIASAPPGALAQANALYGAIDANLAQLKSAFGLKSDRAKNEVAAIVDFADVFLSELASFLPAPAAATVSAGISGQATVKTKAALTGAKVKIVSPKQFAKNFNKASAANFPEIQVAVP